MTIGSGVTTIGSMSFVTCTTLTTIYNYAVTPQEIDFYTFLQVPTAACTLYVPEESVELYKAAPVWKNFEVKPITGTGIGEVKEVREVLGEPSDQGRAKEVKDNSWFTLDGRRLDGRSTEGRLQGKKPAQSGIYVNGERKVVIK